MEDTLSKYTVTPEIVEKSVKFKCARYVNLWEVPDDTFVFVNVNHFYFNSLERLRMKGYSNELDTKLNTIIQELMDIKKEEITDKIKYNAAVTKVNRYFALLDLKNVTSYYYNNPNKLFYPITVGKLKEYIKNNKLAEIDSYKKCFNAKVLNNTNHNKYLKPAQLNFPDGVSLVMQLDITNEKLFGINQSDEVLPTPLKNR